MLRRYDPSSSNEHIVEFSDSGFEVTAVSLNQKTLVALAGGNLKYGAFRIGRCTVEIPSMSALISTALFGSRFDAPIRVHVDSITFDKLPFPDVAMPAEVEAVREEHQRATRTE